jgi:hypothetical protein
MKTNHTPGPWHPGREDGQSFDASTGQPFSSVYADDKRGGRHLGHALPLTIALVQGENIGRGEEKANARLISAAPELFDLAQAIIERGPGATIGDSLFDSTKNHVAKALGEQE